MQSILLPLGDGFKMMNREDIHVDAFDGPFPHLVIKNFYNEQELDLIWEELNFYTKPNK